MRAVAFDLDDTLYDEHEFVRGGFAAVADYLGRQHGVDRRSTARRMEELLADAGRGRVFDLLLAELGLDRAQSVATLVYLYRAHEPHIELFPDVQPLFETLRADGRSIAILTDGLASVQRRKIAALDLDRLVDLTVIASELPDAMGKPSSAPYRVLLDLLDLGPDEVAYVGNDPVRDFAGAHEVGMRTYRVRQPPPTVSLSWQSEMDAQQYVDPFSRLGDLLLSG